MMMWKLPLSVFSLLWALGQGMEKDGKRFHIVNIAPYCNRVILRDWNDPTSFAGLVPGFRYVYGVPFFLVDPVLNDGKAAVAGASVPVGKEATHLFALITGARTGAHLLIRFTDGTQKVVPLDTAVPVIIAHPPLYEWHLDLIAVTLAKRPKGVHAVRVQGALLFALTLGVGVDEEFRRLRVFLGEKRRQLKRERKLWGRLSRLHKELKPLWGKIAVLPCPPPFSPRAHPIVVLLGRAKLADLFFFLRPREFIDPEFFNARRFPVAFYLSGERFYTTVASDDDGIYSLQEFLRDGGILFVWATQPFPFYYDPRGRVVNRAHRLGLTVIHGWEHPPKGRALIFKANRKQTLVPDLPASLPYPKTGDIRWRPIVPPKGKPGDDFHYTPLYSLVDEEGNRYGEGAAILEYRTGPVANGRLLYVWHRFSGTDAEVPLLSGLLKFLAKAVTERPPLPRCIIYRARSPLRIDGRLDETDWHLAPPLTLQEMKGRPALKTRAKLLWDDRFLYLAFECTDDDIWATLKRRDAFLWTEEVVEAFIDPDGDGQNYFEFQVNPLNTQIDLLIPDALEGVKDAHRNARWDCQGWVSAVRVHGTVKRRDDKDKGWTVEMAIPLESLAFPESLRPRPGISWRLNLYRIDRPKGHERAPLLLAWSKCRRWFHEPDRFGRAIFGGNPYHEDFRWYPDGSDGRPIWRPLSGKWIIKEGLYYGMDSGTDGFIALGAKVGSLRWQDYEVTITFRVLGFGSDWRDGFWLAFRFTDTGNAYSLNLYRGQGGVIQLHKASQGVSTNDTNPMAIAEWKPDSGWHTLQVRVVGDRITAWLDRRKLFSVTDEGYNALPPLKHGAVVLSARRWSGSKGHTRVAIKRVTVTVLSKSP